MITIFVVDRLAENRTKLVDEISGHLHGQIHNVDLIPRVNIVPLSREELKFHTTPDLCIVGPGIVESEAADITAIRKLFPSSALLVRLKTAAEDLAFVEQLARMGVDDIVSEQTSSPEFLKKIILLSRRAAQSKAGTLIVVDGGKGGAGVTSISAALGDALARAEKRTSLLDFDCDTQDLSRFLQARPFVNENLQLLFDQSRPLTQEFIEQCLVPVWEDEPLLRCMPPISESDALFDSRSSYPRTLISILEILDSLNDFVVADCGSARGAVLKTLYRLADILVFVTSNDPAGLYAAADRLRRMKTYLAPDAKIILLSNNTAKFGIPENFLHDELSTVCGSTDQYRAVTIPVCKRGSRWPGSGGTLFSHGGPEVKRAFEQLLVAIGAVEPTAIRRNITILTPAIRASFSRLLKRSMAKIEKPQERLPGVSAQLEAPPALPIPQIEHSSSTQLPEPSVYRTEVPLPVVDRSSNTPQNLESNFDTQESLRGMLGEIQFS